MPPMNDYKCTKCEFYLASGWGGSMYVEDNNGERIHCGHPLEHVTVSEVLGEDASPELVKARTGFNSECVCLDCLHQFEADLGDERANVWRMFYGADREKDERRCPKCRSTNVKTTFELIGSPCPQCKEGVIEEIVTGIVS